MKLNKITGWILLAGLWMTMGLACNQAKRDETSLAYDSTEVVDTEVKIAPAVVTEKVANDSDDPAIWINRKNPAQSMILGTDKGNEANIGAIYAFDLKGNIIQEKTIEGIKRPNNIDVEYGMVMKGDTFDIVVFTERYAEAIRVLRLPEMEFIDNGGIKVFSGEEGTEYTNPMGVAIYKNPENGEMHAMVGRKNGPPDGYLWQYRLTAENGIVTGEKVREFGQFSGKNEIEAIAVDDALGYVYYSDEGAGIRKYYAHPDSGNVALAFFGQEGFQEDHEGISIYPTGDKQGYLLVSDQQDNSFRVYTRSGSDDNPHQHDFIAEIRLSTVESDGSEVTPVALTDQYPQGIFVAMSDDGTFQIYDWRELQEAIDAATGPTVE